MTFSGLMGICTVEPSILVLVTPSTYTLQSLTSTLSTRPSDSFLSPFVIETVSSCTTGMLRVPCSARRLGDSGAERYFLFK